MIPGDRQWLRKFRIEPRKSGKTNPGGMEKMVKLNGVEISSSVKDPLTQKVVR